MLFFNFGCKNSPTFNHDNERDPLSSSFEVPELNSFTIDPNYVNDNRLNGFNLGWSMQENVYFDGFTLQLYDPESQEFIDYQTFPPSSNSFYDTNRSLPLDIVYRIKSFIKIGKDSYLFSGPSEVSYKQNVTEIEAYFINIRAIEVVWNHDIQSSMRLKIERQINDGEFTLIREPRSGVYRRSFIDQLDPNLEDKIRYRAYARTNFSETDTVYSDTISLINYTMN